MAVAHPSLWRPGTQQWLIAEAIVRHDLNRKRAFAIDIRPKVGDEPLIFKGKLADGSYGVLDHADQCRRAWYRTGDILKAIREHGWNPDDAPIEEPPVAPVAAPVAAPEPAPHVPAPTTVSAALKRFYDEVRKLRHFAIARDLDEKLLSMRVVIDGTKAVKAGVPVEGAIASIQATWSAETIAQYRNYAAPSGDPIDPKTGPFDYAGFKPRPSRFAHSTAEYVATLVEANVPVWLHGPAGTGKSSAAKHAATRAGLDYYEVNLAGAMASAVKGKDRLKEFVESEFARAYEHGGVCCLEEFDAAHPTVATAVNNAIAGDEFHNDADGRSIPRHPDFRLIVTANTLGTGATKEFNGRMKLDGATLDRFRMGRVYVGLDFDLERAIFESLALA